MKLFYMACLCLLSTFLRAQDISFIYQVGANPEPDISITKDTKIIKIKHSDNPLTAFTIQAKNISDKHKLIFKDNLNRTLGTFLHSNATVSMNASSDLRNQTLRIIYEDSNAVQTLFTNVFLQSLPVSQLNVQSKIPELLTLHKNPCDKCPITSNALEYDYGTNQLAYIDNRKKLTFGRPVVGRPYTFSVVNVNPFRDSIVISTETADFNTEAPDLFTRAFFPANLQGFHSDALNILADVLALEIQIDATIQELKTAPECSNICKIIKDFKDNTEAHFKTVYPRFDPTTTPLSTYILSELTDVNPVYKDTVAVILNKYRRFYSTKTYYHYKIPQVQNVDEYIFNLSILSKAGTTSNSIVDHQPISAYTVGGVKVDFSSGLFITRLRDHRFSLRADSSVIPNSYGGDSIVYNRRNQIIRQTDDKKLDFGVSALMHLYPRISTNINLALSLGAGLSIGPDPAIRYLGGGSLILGRKARLILTYGIAAGFADRLSDQYQNNQYTSVADVKSLTKKSFKTKSFWGLTFSIPIFKSKVDTAAAATESKETETKTEEKKEEDDK